METQMEDTQVATIPVGEMDLVAAEDNSLETMLESQLVPADAGQPAGDVFSMLELARPVCTKCNTEVDIQRCQVKTRGGQRFVCNSCHARSTALSRAMGGWPAELLAELPQCDLVEFWRSAQTENNANRLAAMLVDKVTEKRVNTIQGSIKGEYLPLSVYGKKGYDVAEIEAKCTDTMMHPILGVCYRVAISSIDRTSMISSEKGRLLEQMQKRRQWRQAALANKAMEKELDKDNLPQLENPGEMAPIADAESDNSEGSSSSNSSSSSSSSKKKKKSKKSNKSKKSKKSKKRGKARASSSKKKEVASKKSDDKEHQAAAKAMAAKEKKVCGAARRAFTRLGGYKETLEKVMKDKNFYQLPEGIREGITSTFQKVVQMRTAAEDSCFSDGLN